MEMRTAIDITNGQEPETEALFEMSNLTAEDTGLPFVVFVSVKGGAKHDVRVKVGPSIKARPELMVSVAIRPQVRDLSNSISSRNMALLRQWIALNQQTIIDYWDGRLSTRQMLAQIQPI